MTEVLENSAYVRTESDLAREEPAADVIERFSRIHDASRWKASCSCPRHERDFC